MKNISYFLCLVTTGLTCTGCWPTHVITSPGASGIVLDRQTRRPLEGAHAAVSRTWEREWPNYGTPTADEAQANTRPPIAVTDANGYFSIPPKWGWIMDYPAPEGHARGTLVVTHEGYKPATLPLIEGLQDDAGKIFLSPVGQLPGQ